MKRFFILAICLLLPVSHLKTYPMQRPNLKDQGYGPVINDLERHAHAGHDMRNEADPGNWAHELTHQVNSDIRQSTRADDDAFYVMDGQYDILLYPDVTLKQVAAEVPESQRGQAYHLYLVEQQRYWNSEALYILDEATAYANGLLYHAVSKTKDATRVTIALEFINYSNALLRTVKKFDPDYPQLDELSWFIKYNNARIRAIKIQYDGDEVPPYDITGDK